MRNLVKYHLITLTPIVGLCFLYSFKVMSAFWFMALFALYALVMRPIIDYKKLRAKGLVTRKSFMRSLGFIRFKYYHELMFED